MNKLLIFVVELAFFFFLLDFRSYWFGVGFFFFFLKSQNKCWCRIDLLLGFFQEFKI